jgi:hypothetical protein
MNLTIIGQSVERITLVEDRENTGGQDRRRTQRHRRDRCAAQSICGLSRPTEKIPRLPKLSWTQALETHRHVSTNGFRMARLGRRPC